MSGTSCNVFEIRNGEIQTLSNITATIYLNADDLNFNNSPKNYGGNYEIVNHFSMFFSDYFVNHYIGHLWYLVGLVGSFLVINQPYINKWLIYSMTVLTFVCGWWNMILFTQHF